jgi:hypothetical protein
MTHRTVTIVPATVPGFFVAYAMYEGTTRDAAPNDFIYEPVIAWMVETGSLGNGNSDDEFYAFTKPVTAEGKVEISTAAGMLLKFPDGSFQHPGVQWWTDQAGALEGIAKYNAESKAHRAEHAAAQRKGDPIT